jgi:serine/threonine protein kinase
MKNNLRVGDRIQDRWEIHKILKGGMGIVYFVYDHESREVYAAKTICHEKIENDPSTVLRFIKEANAWINLDAHPNVVEARMVRTIDGKPYIFLELIAGGDLGTWIGTTRLKFNFHQSLTFALQFCDGMSYANSKGIKAHRDIKPSNCLVADDGSLKITDFGIAKAFDNSELEGSSSNAINSWMASQNLVMTQTGSGLGTCAYMSPEQFDDAKNVDTTADIYSFGIMLYQMITGRLPLSGDNWKVYEHAHKFLKPSGMRSQHPKLEAIVLTCLEKSPRNRYLNFGVLRKELADVYQEITGHPAWPPVAGKEMDEIRLLNKGASLEFLGRFPEALTYFNRSLQINPRQSSALYNKGVLALKQEQYEEALAFTDESLAIDPRSFRAWSNKAAILWKLERHKEQYECCNKALAINPNDPRALTLKGIAVNASGQYEAALELYEKALNSAPHFIQALVYRGISLIGLSQFNEAIDSFDLALQRTGMDTKSNRMFLSR